MRQTFNQVRDGQFEEVEARLAPSLQGPGVRASLEQVRAIIAAAGTPCERSMVLWNATHFAGTSGSGRRVSAQHQYACPTYTLLVSTRLFTPGSESEAVIEHFTVNTIDPEALARVQSFELSGQSLRHYAFLVAMGVTALLMLLAFFGTLFTKNFKRKWLWAIVSFAGVCKFAMIWTTGQISTSLLSIHLLGLGYSRGPFTPWELNFTLPAGALIVLSLLWPRWFGSYREPGEQPPA